MLLQAGLPKGMMKETQIWKRAPDGTRWCMSSGGPLLQEAEQGARIQARYEGPYKIVEKVSAVMYVADDDGVRCGQHNDSGESDSPRATHMNRRLCKGIWQAVQIALVRVHYYMWTPGLCGMLSILLNQYNFSPSNFPHSSN